MRRVVLSALVVVAATLAPAPADAAALCNGLPVTMTVPPGGAAFPGTAGADVILGSAGPDFIKAGAGDDVVCGGGGDDVILGGPGNDTLLGEDGNDKLRGAAGDDTLRGGPGSDRMLPETGKDLVDGGAGSDIVDYLAASGPVSVDLGAGTAVYSPEGGGTHTATLVAVEKVDGSRYADTLVGNSKRNVLRGKQGTDRIIGGSGDDDLIGGTDRDTIRGGDGADLVKGQAGDDDLDGGIGDDRLVGGAGSDTLVGGDGNDTLIGGLRRHEGEFTNTMAGGDGFDTCRWAFDPITGCETERPAADLDLSMVAIPSVATVGDEVVLRVEVANRGPDTASGVAVAAPLPAGLTYRSHHGPGAYAASSGAWSVGGLAAGASAILEITTAVGPGLPATAAAEITSSSPYDPDSAPGNGAAGEDDRATVTITRPPAADLSLSKSVDDPTPDYGGPVAFTLTVANAGPDPAAGVAVADPLPAGLSFVSAAGDGSYSQATGVWTVGTVQPGSAASMQVVASVGTTNPVVNIAEIAASDAADPDSTPGNGLDEDDRASAGVDAPPAADLSLAMAVDEPAADLGEAVTFTLTVENAGPDPASGVVVTDLLPAGLAYGSDDGAGAYDPASGVWAAGSLAPGASRTLGITATVVSTGTIVNRAEVTASDRFDPDSAPGNGVVGEDDRVSVAVGVQGASDLSLDMAVDDPYPYIGTAVTFTLTVANAGPDPATGIEVADLLPEGLTHLSDDGAGSYDPASGIWQAGSLAEGASRSLQVTASADVAVPVVNTAEISASDQFDPDSTPGNGVVGEDDRISATVDAALDDTPPEPAAFSIAPDSVDIGTGSGQITVTVEVTDDLAGVADRAAIDARFESPTGVHGVYLDFGPPVSGGDLDALFQATGTIPQFSETGTWTLEFLYLEDDAGNQNTLYAADLAALSFPASFQVTGPAPDEEPPGLAGLSISPPQVDVTLIGRPVTMTIDVTDDLSGVTDSAAMWAEFSGPTGRDRVRFDFVGPPTGGDLAATFEATTTVARRSEPGTWALDSLSLEDDTGNRRILDAAAVALLGPPEEFATTFEVVGPADVSPPDLRDLVITPPDGIDITKADQTVTVAIRVTDDLAGVFDGAYMYAEFSSPSGFDRADFDFILPPSGGDLDAWFEASVLVEQGSEPGTWSLATVSIEDDANNRVNLSASDVATLGLPTSFEVIGPPVDRTPPTLLDLSISPATVDPGTGPQDVTLAIQVADDLAGVGRNGDMYAVFQDPWGFEEIELPFGKRVSGTDLNGFFQTTLDDAHLLTPGTWTLAFLYLVDDALNEALFEAGDLAALGFPNSFEVTGAAGGFPF